jgi:pimeloyl-ACP methyl ester carboxylesterase
LARIPAERVVLGGELTIPPGAKGIVLFAYGAGSSRHTLRNQFLAHSIQNSGTGTLLFDLLSPEEAAGGDRDGLLHPPAALLAGRLFAAARWVATRPDTRHLGMGFFGAGTGGAAALLAAATLVSEVGAVVTRGGWADLAAPALTRIQAPTLLVVGERDELVLALNQQAFARLRCQKRVVVVPGATHVFEEPGALDAVAKLAAEWFRQHLKSR